MRFRRRRKDGPIVVPSIPDWADLVDVTSGRVLLDDAPPIDVRGLDVLGQGEGEEGDVAALAEVAFSYFDSAAKHPVAPEPAGEQLPLPAPPVVPAVPVARGGLRLVSSAPVPDPDPGLEVEDALPARVSLFGPDSDDDEDDDD